MTQKPTILMLGCFDTKGEIFSFLRDCLLAQGAEVITVNVGVMGSTTLFPIDVEASKVSEAGGGNLEDIRSKNDRGYAMEIMGRGSAEILADLYKQKKFDAVIGMGGGSGTYVTLKSIKPIIQQAAAAIVAMCGVEVFDKSTTSKRIAISMFGNTSVCVDFCTELLEAKGYEVMTFHANGLGGKAMESLVLEGCFAGVLDITTTELADELCAGVCSAGGQRKLLGNWEFRK